MSKKKTSKKPQKKKVNDPLWDNFKQIAAAVILAIVIKTSVVEAYKIPSASMEDTLLIGDFLLANKFVYGARFPLIDAQLPAIRDPEPGDVVIFIYPVDGATKYIKRCVAVPGDTVEVIDKKLYVNGERFTDPVGAKFEKPVEPRGMGGRSSRDNWGPEVVPDTGYFMMGDNRDNSSDSRFWGPVPRTHILGKAMVVHWSWSEEKYPSPDVSLTDPLSVPRLFLHNTVHFFQKVRWERLFRPIP